MYVCALWQSCICQYILHAAHNTHCCRPRHSRGNRLSRLLVAPAGQTSNSVACIAFFQMVVLCHLALKFCNQVHSTTLKQNSCSSVDLVIIKPFHLRLQCVPKNTKPHRGCPATKNHQNINKPGSSAHTPAAVLHVHELRILRATAAALI